MFNDWLRRRGGERNLNNSAAKEDNGAQKDDVEYYEDTHNERGEYIGRQAASVNSPNSSQVFNSATTQKTDGRIGKESRGYSQQYGGAPTKNAENSPLDNSYSAPVQQESYKMPNNGQSVTQRSYQNVVVYEPRTPEDVQILIDYLKRREPAIINLDNVEADVAQRVLDFVSGAIYALDGSVHRISGNIFLLSPEGVEITVPFTPSQEK